jgi:hypothetical protein
VDPIDGGEGGERRHKHRLGADQYGDAQTECDQAQIHWVAGELIGTASDKFAISRRRRVDFGVLRRKRTKAQTGGMKASTTKAIPSDGSGQAGNGRLAQRYAEQDIDQCSNWRSELEQSNRPQSVISPTGEECRYSRSSSA